MKRELIYKIKTIIDNDVLDDVQMLKQLKNEIFSAEAILPVEGESNELKDLVAKNIAGLKFADGQSNGISSGFPELDKTGTLLPGEFVVIGGRPAMGKTLMLVSLALEIAKTHPLLYFSFDMSAANLAARFMSALTDIDVAKVLRNSLSVDELASIESSATELSNLPIYISESCRDSVSSFKKYCEKMIAENGVEVILVDYIQLMSSNRYNKGRDMELGFISRELKNIAKKHNVLLIASSQLNRSVESRGGDHRPMLSDLRDSGNIEQDADKVIFIHRPEYYGITCDCEGNSLLGVMSIIVAKNKNGRLGEVNLSYSLNKTRVVADGPRRYDFELSELRLKEINNDLSNDSFNKEESPF